MNHFLLSPGQSDLLMLCMWSILKLLLKPALTCLMSVLVYEYICLLMYQMLCIRASGLYKVHSEYFNMQSGKIAIKLVVCASGRYSHSRLWFGCSKSAAYVLLTGWICLHCLLD